MQTPKKITPDSIVKAVVEIKYIAEVPFEILLGILVSRLDQSYTYTNRPINNSPLGLDNYVNPADIIININSRSLVYNNKISIQFQPNSLIFSCIDKYIGGVDFLNEIKAALSFLLKNGEVKKWTRIGLRYISEYPNRDIRECIKFNFTFGLPDVESVSTHFKSEFFYKGTKVILNLMNKMPALGTDSKEATPHVVNTSIIDIDVINDRLEIPGLQIEPLINEISLVHDFEKEIFFGMLREEFLNTLQPEY
ncbi:MAG: TIGR04255 family protein [Niastella sp.]|nr:TIGR04255 family protein [Niastella sp.]